MSIHAKLQRLEEMFTVYPDAWAIRIHRDPLKSLPSTTSLMGTLKRMRCEEVPMETAAELAAAPPPDVSRVMTLLVRPWAAPPVAERMRALEARIDSPPPAE